MATADLGKLLDHVHHRLLAGQDDGHLLGQFLATGDEAAFTALVRRHGRLVFGVCNRVLRHQQDAEDAFQATFLILARKAAAVQRGSLASWLYGVAYRTALEARSRRRTRERQVERLPHPEWTPSEPQDWRLVLDEEVNRLSEKYRAAVVLCDLGGLSRREAARQLGVPEGTLSSRLAAAHKLLGQRLSRRGVALSGTAVAAALAEGSASAQVPPLLAATTAKVVALVAAGQLAAVSPSAAALTQGVLKTMLLAKLKVAFGSVAVLLALGAGGVIYQGGSSPASAQVAQEKGRPSTEVESLRRENELLKLNLQVVLEKVRSQEAELLTLRKTAVMPGTFLNSLQADPDGMKLGVWKDVEVRVHGNLKADEPQVAKQPSTEMAEAALKALREARTPPEKQRATEALEKAVKALKGRVR